MNEPPPTILLVEDNEDDVYVMQRALKKSGIINPVRIAPDGEEALSYLAGTGAYANRAEHPLPFLVFLDIKLPFVDGFETLAWMRERGLLETIAVVMLTSSAEARDREKAAELGARAYVVKPPKVEDLRATLEALRSFWRERRGAFPVAM
ncbi:MAG TPA: response regulator [Verrucomicrobiae bacterium]|jgi:CheY-like chemotaxis protein|nr:response regulator [Verrucomicrobiae bacterium]